MDANQEVTTNSLKAITDGVESLADVYNNDTVYHNESFNFYDANKLKVDSLEHINNKKAKIELGHRFRWSLERLMNHRQETVHKKRIQAIKDYQLTNIDRALELKRKKRLRLTNEKIPIIRSYVDRGIKALFEWKFAGKVYWWYGKDGEANKEFIQHYANRIYSSAEIRKNLIEQGTDSLLLGNGFSRTSFDPIPFSQKQTQELFKKNNDAEKPDAPKVTVPFAKSEYVSPFNIYAEPYTDFYEQPIYHREIMSIDNVIENYKNFFKLDKDQLSFILKAPQYFSTVNYNKIKLIKYYEDFLINNSLDYGLTDLYKINPKTNPVEVVEYEYKNNLVIMLNGYIVYDHINPFYYEEDWVTSVHRYKTLCSSVQWWTRLWQWQGITLAGIQKMYDSLFNMMFDLAKFAAGPMFIAEPGQWIEWCESQLNYEPYSIKQSRGLQDAKLTPLELPKPDAVNFTVMNNLLEYANMLISPTVYNQMQTQSRSAADSEYRKEWLKTQLNDLAESYGSMFNSMLKDYIMYGKKAFGNKEVEILALKDGKEVRKKISAKNLRGNYIYETEFESMKDINNVLEKSQYLEFMDFVSKYWQDPLTNTFMLNMRKLIFKWLELFDQDTWALMDKAEYLKVVKEMEEEKMKIQADLQKAQQEIYREAGVEPQYGQDQWQGQPQAQEEQGWDIPPQQVLWQI